MMVNYFTFRYLNGYESTKIIRHSAYLVLSGIVIVGIVAFVYLWNYQSPPNRHIGDNKPWNEKMSQGSADTKTCS